MQFDKIRNKGQGRLFENERVEALTKTSPLVIYSIYFPVMGLLLWYAVSYYELTASTTALLFAGGMLVWTLFEYAMHRYLFHMVAESKRAQRILYTMHGVHHEYPRDRERLFMPPVPSVIVSSIILGILYLIMGPYAFAFFPGFILGYLLYGSMHYAIHAYAPPRFLKALWRNHHLHHYKQPDKGFGVSSVLWDVVFGTLPEKQANEEKQVRAVPHTKPGAAA
jgi:sterol desaturase/sphingolipid hydroxylase (fatty acid hydroxylase superfamily)